MRHYVKQSITAAAIVASAMALWASMLGILLVIDFFRISRQAHHVEHYNALIPDWLVTAIYPMPFFLTAAVAAYLFGNKDTKWFGAIAYGIFVTVWTVSHPPTTGHNHELLSLFAPVATIPLGCIWGARRRLAKHETHG